MLWHLASSVAVRRVSVVHSVQTSASLKTAWPIKAKFHVDSPIKEGTKIYINGTGHMAKMAAMPIYVKTL